MDPVSEMKLQIFSNQYYDFVDSFAKSDFESGKILGKYYTEVSIAENMIKDLLIKYKLPDNITTIRVIDPFCGDGRLITILLSQVAKLDRYKKKSYEIVIWDIDGDALKKAKNSISKIIEKLGIEASIRAEKVDAYVMYSIEEENFSICVTNPPWGLLKPQKIFNERYTQKEIEDYKKSIALYDDYMKSEFPLSQPTKKFGKWGTNLARTGVEVALKLVSNGGICGIVSPASLFNDQVSVPLRRWIFERHDVYSICYYPAELKLFGTADISSITAVIEKNQGCKLPYVKIYKNVTEHESMQLTEEDLDYLRKNQYSLPLEFGFTAIDLYKYLDKLPTVYEFCQEHHFRFVRELDETRVAEKLCTDGKIVFAKGYMVDRYQFNEDGLYLNEEKVCPPITVDGWKLVWRDVSRNSQKRRIKATILNPGCIVGNSLGAICNMNEVENTFLFSLLAVMNSIVFEFQARGQLVSNHVSAGVIKQLRIPVQMDDERLQELVCNNMKTNKLEWEIEIRVAQLYGISREQFLNIISRFEFSREELDELNVLLELYY